MLERATIGTCLALLTVLSTACVDESTAAYLELDNDSAGAVTNVVFTFEGGQVAIDSVAAGRGIGRLAELAEGHSIALKFTDAGGDSRDSSTQVDYSATSTGTLTATVAENGTVAWSGGFRSGDRSPNRRAEQHKTRRRTRPPGVLGASRDFRDSLDVNRAALATLDGRRGSSLSRQRRGSWPNASILARSLSLRRG